MMLQAVCKYAGTANCVLVCTQLNSAVTPGLPWFGKVASNFEFLLNMSKRHMTASTVKNKEKA